MLVCDGSRALETASISAFTNFLVIEHYCDMFLSQPTLYLYYISKDVAHNIKLWATFLSNKNKSFRVFYLACIGQLILCDSLKDILTMIFAISLGETKGKMDNNENSYTQKCKDKLEDISLLSTNMTGCPRMCFIDN